MPQKKSASNADIDDKALFREAMQDVAPLTTSDKTILKPKKPAPSPRPKDHHEQFSDTGIGSNAFSVEIDAGDGWFFLRPGVTRQALRRLKRSYWGVQDSLDLHGFTQEAARQQLNAFLDEVLERNFRCVKIIHGKGLSSKERIPVLKNRIGSWLAQREAVLAFCQARQKDGGGGAVMVLLRKQEKG